MTAVSSGYKGWEYAWGTLWIYGMNCDATMKTNTANQILLFRLSDVTDVRILCTSRMPYDAKTTISG